jgi:hypothetical protein
MRILGRDTRTGLKPRGPTPSGFEPGLSTAITKRFRGPWPGRGAVAAAPVTAPTEELPTAFSLHHVAMRGKPGASTEPTPVTVDDRTVPERRGMGGWFGCSLPWMSWAGGQTAALARGLAAGPCSKALPAREVITNEADRTRRRGGGGDVSSAERGAADEGSHDHHERSLGRADGGAIPSPQGGGDLSRRWGVESAAGRVGMACADSKAMSLRQGLPDSFGSPATSPTTRPVALRPHLAMGLPFREPG